MQVQSSICSCSANQSSVRCEADIISTWHTITICRNIGFMPVCTFEELHTKLPSFLPTDLLFPMTHNNYLSAKRLVAPKECCSCFRIFLPGMPSAAGSKDSSSFALFLIPYLIPTTLPFHYNCKLQ